MTSALPKIIASGFKAVHLQVCECRGGQSELGLLCSPRKGEKWSSPSLRQQPACPQPQQQLHASLKLFMNFLRPPPPLPAAPQTILRGRWRCAPGRYGKAPRRRRWAGGQRALHASGHLDSCVLRLVGCSQQPPLEQPPVSAQTADPMRLPAYHARRPLPCCARCAVLRRDRRRGRSTPTWRPASSAGRSCPLRT